MSINVAKGVDVEGIWFVRRVESRMADRPDGIEHNTFGIAHIDYLISLDPPSLNACDTRVMQPMTLRENIIRCVDRSERCRSSHRPGGGTAPPGRRSARAIGELFPDLRGSGGASRVAPSDQASIGGEFGQSELGPGTRAEGSERLAHFKAPRSVEFVEKLPRTETGKLLKRELQQAYRPALR
jgi:acyl-CoA synthetase (AMP-forming)/AMP-acid ligase II